MLVFVAYISIMTETLMTGTETVCMIIEPHYENIVCFCSYGETKAQISGDREYDSKITMILKLEISSLYSF